MTRESITTQARNARVLAEERSHGAGGVMGKETESPHQAPAGPHQAPAGPQQAPAGPQQAPAGPQHKRK